MTIMMNKHGEQTNSHEATRKYMSPAANISG
jgi:hypothetical protein